MAARLTDKQKKKIIADYVELGSYYAVSKLHGISDNTVKKIVKADADTAKMCELKKEQNAKDILQHMEESRDKICQIMDKYLAALMDDKKIAKATTAQLTTSLGTLIDKWAMVSGGTGTGTEVDGLSKSLEELAKELESE